MQFDHELIKMLSLYATLIVVSYPEENQVKKYYFK